MKFTKIILVVCLALSIPLNAKQITINFQNTPITDVIKFVSTKNKKNILINENISGNVNFISNTPIDDSELMPLLEHVLMVKGYALSANAKGYYEVVRAATASKNVTFDDKYDVGMKMVILRPKHSKPSVITGKIQNLASQYATITHDDAMGILLVSDYPKNITNMKKLLKLFDTTLRRNTKRVVLENSYVKTAVPKLQSIFDNTKDDYKDKIILVGDDFQNAIWVSANSEDIIRAVDFVKTFDIHAKDSNVISTKIIFLKNANVEDIAKTAEDIAKSNDLNRPIKSVVSSNKELNALVISSTYSQIKELEEIITQLDIERRQVFVKVHIYEISQNDLVQFGIKWGAVGGAAGEKILGSGLINMGGVPVLQEVASIVGSLENVNTGAAIGATIDLLQQDGAVNVISEPNLLSVNNIKSTIYVGKTQSILTSDATGSNSLDVTRNNYSREDIGLTLEVTPQIADEDSVVLKILVNIEDVDGATASDQPTTTKRKIDTTAIVQNEDSILIGGLIRDSNTDTVSKVPLLGDIPFFGGLFRSSETRLDKTATIISLTPYIITSSKDLTNMQKKLDNLNLLKRELSDKIKSKLQKQKKKAIAMNDTNEQDKDQYDSAFLDDDY